MMLSKPLVSFIAAFAVATGVSATATPVARDGQCNVNSVACCTQTYAQSNPLTGIVAGLLGIPLDAGAILGLNCIGIVSSTQCTTAPVCCNGVTQTGLINVACTPITVGA